MQSSGGSGPSTTAVVLLGVLANAIWAAIAVGGHRLLTRVETNDPRRRRVFIIAIPSAVATVLIISLLIGARLGIGYAWGWLLVVLATGWSLLVVWRELIQFWRVGLVGADATISAGLSYDPALKLVQTELSFLGTGAHKLSRSPEFALALRRCRSDVPIRLLLRKPSDPTLAAASRRAGHSDAEYANNVIESLRLIARLQEAIANIEVRFYEGDPVFRIMLIDRRLALVSFNVYGHGDGSELPQVHVLDVSGQRDVSNSFFHAYERLFNERWNQSSVWDFQEFT